MACGGKPRCITKVENFMTKVRAEPPTLLPKYDDIYILSDSKGGYLKRVFNNIVDITKNIDPCRVHFWSRKGQNSADGLKFLESKTHTLERGKSIVLFWHVTCDISTLKRPERYLVNRFKTDEELLEHLGPTFDGLEQLHNTFKFDVGILETPPMFWYTWNQQHGDPDWQTRDYMIFHNQVTAVNSRIQEINNRLEYRSPMFVCDSMVFRKLRKNADHKQALTATICPDGIHPHDSVSEKWLYQILTSVSALVKSNPGSSQ